MLKVSIRGKLYLVGEYNVIKPFSKAILIASNKTVDFTISPAIRFQIEELSQTYYFALKENRVVGLYKKHLYTSISLEIAHDYLSYLNIKINPYRLSVINHLRGESKYGLGSSSATFVGIIKTVLLFHQVDPDDLTLFKLAVIAQKRARALTSGGDIALCITGTTTYYQSYDFDWLENQVQTVSDLIAIKWPGLEIKPLNKIGQYVYVIYSGVSHKTKNDYLNKVLLNQFYQVFSSKANQIVDAIKIAFEDTKKAQLGDKISEYQSILNDLSKHLEVPFMIDELDRMIRIFSSAVKGVKISGAGFGDSIICVSDLPIRQTIEQICLDHHFLLIDEISF